MTTNWKEEFYQFMETLPKRVGETPKDLLLDFITTLLEKQREEYVEMIEKLKHLERVTISCGPIVLEKAVAYNQAIDDIINLLKSHDKTS